jgi:hypothetical protein
MTVLWIETSGRYVPPAYVATLTISPRRPRPSLLALALMARAGRWGR